MVSERVLLLLYLPFIIRSRAIKKEDFLRDHMLIYIQYILTSIWLLLMNVEAMLFTKYEGRGS